MRSAASAPAASGHREASRHKALRTAAMVVAATFVLVGIAGFIPGITTNVDELRFAGPHEGTGPAPELLGLFHVSVLHNLVHLLFGIVGLALARSARGAARFLVGGGLVYALVLVYGLVVDHDKDANFLPVNDADNVLHALLAVAMIGLGVALSPRRADEPADTTADTL
jgi:hypothetical protein